MLLSLLSLSHSECLLGELQPLELRSESDELTLLDGTPLSSTGLFSSAMLSDFWSGEEGAASLPFWEWTETWSAGKAVLQGMGLEITRDFFFFDLVVVLFKEQKYSI